MELCSRFVDPLLSGLFDDPDQGIFLRWTNETTLEAKIEQSLLSWRPDLCITRLQGNPIFMEYAEIFYGSIASYALILPSSGLYIMYEITKVQIPDSLHDLSKLVMDISNLLIVLDTFDKVCIPSAYPSPLELHRPTIISSTLD
ncbi:hypothetical protein BD408DRAFT_443868 [Parasitella parasitica]|nr:hypothetical protein BD408DRAFT_443868 [Parasitella parasitica]